MSSLNATSIDLSVFNQQQQQEAACNNDFKSCECIKRVLTALQHYSLLDLHSNKDHQIIFNNFLNTVYSPSDLIMDFFHFKNIHDQEIQQIMVYALDYFKFPLCDVESCLFSSRLYRVNEAAAILNIFDSDDKTSSLPVVISLLDSIHHYIFHLSVCGLRDFQDKDSDNKANEDQGDEYHDAEFAVMNKRILSTRPKTQKFSRLSAVKKFSINIKNNNNNDDLKEESDGDVITYLDTIYMLLEKEGVNKKIISNLKNFVINEQFDTESMDLDLKIDDNDGNGGNIERTIKNDQCIKCIKNMFTKSTRMIYSFFMHEFFLL